MNKIEKLVYDCVKSCPAIKFVLRNIYQSFYDLLPKPGSLSAERVFVKENYFFGFHDKSPFSSDEKKLLANHTKIPVRMPYHNEGLSVGFFDLSEDGKIGNFRKIGTSYSWNYHKGCRLQWISNNIIYNTRENEKLVSHILDLEGNLIDEIPYPIDTVSENGRYATSFSYERLNVLMPGYGYEDISDGGCLNENAPDDTGLYIIDLEKKERKLLFSLKALAESLGDSNAMYSRHYVTHSEFSKDNRYVSFLHRWIEDDYRKRHSRLVVYDLFDNKMYVLPTTGMVSHYVWNKLNQIVAYCSVKEGDAHVLFDIGKQSYEPILLGKLNCDGHQSFIDDVTFITDTYPDKYRMATLYEVSIKKNTYKRIAYLYSPKKYQTKDFHKHIACDLHPRVSPSGKYVCFDSVFTGVRSICILPLN